MAKPPIEIGISSETKAFKQGVEGGIIKPLEDASDKLDDLGKSKGPDQLERELVEAQKATKQLGREVDRTADDIERDFRDSYRSAERSADDFHGTATENVQGFKDEAIQNFSEVASSFDGDMQSMADGVQGLTGGLASSLTPGVGIPIAIIGAIAGAWLQSWAETTEEAKQRVSDMYQDMIESGQAFLSEDFVTKALGDIIDDDGKLAKAREDSKKFGLDMQTILRAQAGDQAAINIVIEQGRKLREEEVAAAYSSGQAYDVMKTKADEVNLQWDRALGTYTDVNSEIQKSVDKVNLYREATDKAASADQKRWEALGRALAGTPTQIVVDVDTSAAEKKIGDFLRIPRKVGIETIFETRNGSKVP